MKPRATIRLADIFSLIFTVLVLTGCGDTSMPTRPTLGQADETDVAADKNEGLSSSGVSSATSGGSVGSGLAAAQPPAAVPTPAPSPDPWTTSPPSSPGGTFGSQLPSGPASLLGNISGLLGPVFSTATGLLSGILPIPQNLPGFGGSGNGP